MKILGRLALLYGVLCALLVTPLIGAILFAKFSDKLPEDFVQKLANALEKEPPVKVEEENTESEEDLEKRLAQMPDSRLWDRRLREMGAKLKKQAQELKRDMLKLEAMRAESKKTTLATAKLLEVILQEPVSEADVSQKANDFVARLEVERSAEERLPWMKGTLESMESKAIATLFTQPVAGQGMELQDVQIVKLLGGLPPRKAGGVLAEMGKVNPQKTTRLLALMGTGKSGADSKLNGQP